MNLQECYTALGGNYAEVSSRLHSERLVQKFVLKFLDDKSYELLCTSMAEKNYEEAFRAAHTIKGVCQNLGFNRLLRNGWTPEADTLVGQVEEDYRITVEAIQEFRKGCGGQ